MVTLADLIGEAGIKLDEKGLGLCPFHEDTNRSLSVDFKKGLWHCFGCSKGGSSVDWLVASGKDLKEALALAKPREPGAKVKPKDPQRTEYQWVGPGGTMRQTRWDFFDGRAKALRWEKGSKPKRFVHHAKPQHDTDPTVLVWAEGAKDSQAVAAAGYTCAGIGGGDVIPEKDVLEWVYKKERQDWILWPDNDQVGISAMHRVAKSAPKQVKIFWVHPPSKLKKGEGAADCLHSDILTCVSRATRKPPVLRDTENRIVDWELDGKDNPVKDSPHNARFLMDRLGFSLRWDLLSDCCVVKKESEDEEVLADKHWHKWFTQAKERYGYAPTPINKFNWYLYDHARKREFHPILDYLDGCPAPDSKESAEGILFDLAVKGFAVDPEDHFSQVAMAKTLAAAVRRVREPGCMWKYVPVFVSDQDKRKSSAIFALVPKKHWVLDTFDFTASAKERGENLTGVWIVECAEIDDMRRVSPSRVKAIISSRADRYRKAYGIESVTAWRKCIFIGTVNDPDFLSDPTGNKRFWPIRTLGDCDDAWIAKNREAIWGAANLFEQGENLWMDDEILEAEAESRQEEARTAHPWEEILSKRIDLEGKMSSEILAHILVENATKKNQMTLAHCMRILGYDKKRKQSGGVYGHRWYKILEDEQDELPF